MAHTIFSKQDIEQIQRLAEQQFLQHPLIAERDAKIAALTATIEKVKAMLLLYEGKELERQLKELLGD